MSIFDRKLIHVRRLYISEGVSLDRGRRVLRDLERRGAIDPEVVPSGREFISANEAETFHKAIED